MKAGDLIRFTKTGVLGTIIGPGHLGVRFLASWEDEDEGKSTMIFDYPKDYLKEAAEVVSYS
jgi:hypothetical protein